MIFSTILPSTTSYSMSSGMVVVSNAGDTLAPFPVTTGAASTELGAEVTLICFSTEL